MTESRRAAVQAIEAAVAASLLVAAIDLLTNSIDIAMFSWDFRYYIDMAEHGFAARMASPFAYRYLTALLARGVSMLLQISIETGFSVLAKVGAATQLLAVFLLTRWYTRSSRGAWLAMFVAAFSLFNIKFLLFDTFRPDHLAYALILLQAYFALTGRFAPLLITTMIGCQIREFNAIPLVAYLYASMGALGPAASPGARRKATLEATLSMVGLAVALVLPRMLIPVAQDFQFVTLTQGGVLRVLLAPFVLPRDANFIFSLIAYGLPIFMMGGLKELQAAFASLRGYDRRFLGAYSFLVLVLSFLGGTDFFRFSTYLVLPQSILLGMLGDKHSWLHIGIMLAGVFVFNRIWLPFPSADVDAYLDFYGAYGTRFNSASVWRILECAALIAVGVACRRLLVSNNGRTPLPAK